MANLGIDLYRQVTSDEIRTDLLLGDRAAIAQALAAGPIDVGSRRELFVDQFLIDRRDGVDSVCNGRRRARSC